MPGSHLLAAEFSICSVSASAGNQASMGTQPAESTGSSSSMGPPQTEAGDTGAVPPTPAEGRWSSLVRQLFLLFHLRRYWSGLGAYLKNFTALR